MNTQKLAKQLKKELTRNPKKTAALALVSVVALWFWAPLATKWLGGAKKPKRPVAAAAVVETPAVAPPAVAGATATPQIAWDKLLEQIAADQHMASATVDATGRDPFAVTATEQSQTLAPANPAAAAAVGAPAISSDPTPESLGLTLQGTLVAGHMRQATVNGKRYREGSRIKLAPQAGSAANGPPIEFEVTQIEARQVTLARNGKEYSLALKLQPLGEGEQLTFGTYSSAPESE